MLRAFGHSCVLLLLVITQGCNHADVYAQKAKTLDSLGGALNAMVKEFERTDTLLLQRSINRFNDYSRFIRQHISDTIQKSEADELQHFYAGGQSLQNFARNRVTILARAALITAQLNKLAADIKNKAVHAQQLEVFVAHEQQSAAQLMEAGYAQQKQFHSGFEEFKNALPGVEQLIRSRNRGELPTIIKDTVNL